MITIGTTTWSEHQELLNQEHPLTLAQYAAFFPVVEVDTFFYAIPKQQTVLGWQRQVPNTFKFVVKANRLMTGHTNDKITFGQLKQVFANFLEAIAPLYATGQLQAVLFQFPPYFKPTKKRINYLRQLRILAPDIPICLEFRNQNWYQKEMLPSLLKFCSEQNLSLTVVDEPQQTTGSVPFLPLTTTSDLMLWRLHGRNQQGWLKKGPNWRKERTLYRYSQNELKTFAQTLIEISPKPKEICVIFNNNSGGDAAPNALALKELLHLEFDGLLPKPPTQIDLL